MADLVVFGEDWGGLPSSTQHLITHLMKKHRVIWVNSIGMRNPRLNIRDLSRIFKKLAAMMGSTNNKPVIETNVKPHIINPRVIPFHGFKLIRKLNQRLLQKTIQQAMDELGFEDIILWTSLPTAVDMIGSLDEKVSIYYCGDDFDALDGVDHHIVRPMERELANKVDLILVVSRELADKLPGPNTVMLSHGVDYSLFANPKNKPLDLPDNGPIAGFYGSLSAWLDVEMLAQSAIALPGWQFVFIGDIKTDVTSLQELPNIHFLGPKSHKYLPAYVQHWDVAMLPFRHNKQIEACNPLKLREYLASGTPIASTSFPAVRVYGKHVAIQQPREPFSRVIQRASEQALQKDERQQLVAPESWENRAAQLEELIAHLDQKQPDKSSYTY